MENKVIVSRGFEHKGKSYVLKVFQAGLGYTVKPYLNDMEASYYSYSVTITNMDGWRHLYGDQLPYERLLEIAEQDIREGYGLKQP